MELVAIENCRVLCLTQMYRPAGQLFLPAAAAKLISRYSFAKPPSTIDDLSKDVVTFSIGAFGDIAINELTIYPDGLVAVSKSNTSKIRSFIVDLLEWAKKEFGIIELDIVPTQTYYESAIVVRAASDVLRAVKPMHDAAAALRKRLIAQADAVAYEPFAFVLDVDSTRTSRRLMRFTLERRIGVPFEENVFFSIAPLETDDHIEFLGELEKLFSRPETSKTNR
jgi:hypothetical protein